MSEGLEWETSFNRLKYDCSNCPVSCCTLYEIRLTGNDVNRLAGRHKNLSGIVELKDEKTTMRRLKDNTCIMLEKSLCRIHEIKPRVCKTFPLFLNPASDGRMKVDCVRLCPESNEGLRVDEEEVGECVTLIAREYGDYYGMQAKHYRSLTDRLKDKHPLLENLEQIEKLTENALRESLQKEFNPDVICMQVGKLAGTHSGKKEEHSPLDSVQDLLECGVNAIKYTPRGVEECEIKMVGSTLIAMGKALDYDEVKTPKLNASQRRKTLEYLTETSKRGNASQYVVKSLRDGRKKSIFEAMADYLHYHACTLAVYLNLYESLEEAIASKEYSFNRRIDTLLS